MPREGLPIPIAKGIMNMLPALALDTLIGVVVCRMRRRHPRLFKNMAEQDPAVVHIEPTDQPHRFALNIGQSDMLLAVLGADDKTKPDACISGPLETLLDMLEGRTDGDTEFFARGITVTGDMSVIVALRNTLDREEINLLDDVMSFCGPFAKPVSVAVTALDRLGRRLRGQVRA